jgi:hypothetical protein
VKYLYVSEMIKKDQNGEWNRRVKVMDIENKKKKHQKIEDYDWVIEKKLPVDLYWYLTSQIQTTIELCFGRIMERPVDLIQDVLDFQKRKQLGIKEPIDEKLKPATKVGMSSMFKRMGNLHGKKD